MGAYITNKYIFWHTLLPQNKPGFDLYSVVTIVFLTHGPRDIDPGLIGTNKRKIVQELYNGTWDIDPRSRLFSGNSYHVPRHTILPLYEFFTPSFFTYTNLRNTAVHVTKMRADWYRKCVTLASSLTIKGKLQY